MARHVIKLLNSRSIVGSVGNLKSYSSDVVWSKGSPQRGIIHNCFFSQRIFVSNLPQYLPKQFIQFQQLKALTDSYLFSGREALFDSVFLIVPPIKGRIR